MKSPLFTRESGDRFDSCLSCEFFNPLGRVRIHQGSMCGTLFSTSKDDSLDKKQIQIIVVKVVKLILIQHLSFFDRMKEMKVSHV